jgi:hypothetical protein
VPTCANVSKGFDSHYALSSAVLAFLMSSDAISTSHLMTILEALGIYRPERLKRPRLFCIESLRTYDHCSNVPNVLPVLPERLFDMFSKLKKDDLVAICLQHGLSHLKDAKVENLKDAIMKHVASGDCVPSSSSQPNIPVGCHAVCQEYLSETASPGRIDLQIFLLSSHVKTMKASLLRRILNLYGIEYSSCDSVSRLRKHLKSYVSSLRRGKRTSDQHYAQIQRKDNQRIERDCNLSKIRAHWPQLISNRLKEKILQTFHDRTSPDALASFTCASCAGEYLKKNKALVPLDDIDLDLLAKPAHLPETLQNSCVMLNDHSLLVDPAGLSKDDDGNIHLSLCKECRSSLQHGKIPPLSLVNRNFLGPIPEELRDLTVIEEAMIAQCRAKCWIVQLKEDRRDTELPNVQRGLKGHIIVYPQRPADIAKVLPPSMNDVLTPICVLFIGSKTPSADWLRVHAKPLCVRREKVRAALLWLKRNNPLYHDVVIDFDRLNSLPEEHIPPFHIEHVVQSDATESLTSRYEPEVEMAQNWHAASNEIPFQNVVITDVDAHAPSHELRAAALRHVKMKGGGYIQIPHDPKPVNEFFNPELLPRIYPTLFPYGIGGPKDPCRSRSISFARHIKHYFNLNDRRFQEHYSFLFTTFNIMQRRTILLNTSLKMKKSSFERLASAFGTVSPETVHIVSERVSHGDFTTVHNSEEKKVLELLKQVKAVTYNVPGSSSSKLVMRNEIRALMIEKGMPSFYVTINPADVYNPIVRFLAGKDVNIENLVPTQFSPYQEQSILVAKNPVIAAKFFNLYMKAFISTILGFDPKYENLEGGILGLVKAYYGCVEAQERGTLHCHMLIWVEGALNPDEIKKKIIDHEFQSRLLDFLGDTISNSIPIDPDPLLHVPSSDFHPCAVRGYPKSQDPKMNEKLRRKDLFHLVSQCQLHKHTHTCYKYWKGPPEPKTCRFDMSENNTRTESKFDLETGELCLRCLDGLVNNFNETMILAVRCNMDIKFIGSGAAAKAMIFYITDYITKSELKAHIAYAALDLAVRKLGEYDVKEDEITFRAKGLLQRCAYSLISHQELSAQQVASYIKGYEDHFTSHSYRNLYWTSFERWLDSHDPSPECHTSLKTHTNSEAIEENVKTNDTTECDNIENEESVNIHEPEPDEDDYDDQDNVTISFSPQGELLAKSNQVTDYLWRGRELDNLCLWDFISKIDKVTKKSMSRTATQFDEEDEGTIYSPESSEDKQTRKTIPFLSQHPETNTHVLHEKKPVSYFIPVPMGASLPRRDRPDVYEWYCWLMLIFFKSWRKPEDLREHGQSWSDAFNSFVGDQCSNEVKSKLDNMQILHECKDSRDDHFLQRQKERRLYTKRMKSASNPKTVNRPTNDDFGVAEDDAHAILDHLESIQGCSSQHAAKLTQSVTECLSFVDQSRMFDMSTIRPPQNNDFDFNEACIDIKDSEDSIMNEDIWKVAYENRRQEWKEKSQCEPITQSTSSKTISTAHSLMNDGSTFREVHEATEDNILHTSVRRDTIIAHGNEISLQHTADDVLRKFTLNSEQSRAFKIITDHNQQKNNNPLRMFISGAAGTGKSRIINGLQEYFRSTGQERRFHLSAYTGIAAKNIGGATLHTLLCLNQRNKKKISMKTTQDLIAMWQGVDYLFIDEISMVGCNLLLQISEALNEAKGNTLLFGGINVIFAGDFCQLPPVGQTRLYSRLNTSCYGSASKRGQNDILGKLLWLSVKTVVVLNDVMRQSGHENENFVGLLSRLRQGKCTNKDFETLESRIISNLPQIDWTTWRDIPIIVSDNATKDSINTKATRAFAERTGQPMHWYYATDIRGGQPITDINLETHLHHLDSGQTNQRLGRIPLVPGMPIVITQNFDVESGIVNGTTGILKKIHYYTDDHGRRHAISCVIHSMSITGPPLPNLSKNEGAILEDTLDMHFIHPYSQKKNVQ